VLALAFLATRLPALTLLPVSAVEGIQLSWARETARTGELLDIARGGRYLPTWLAALALSRGGDPLRLGRLVSVAAGLLSVLGLVVLGRQLGRERAGWLAAVLYTLVPFTLFHDRLALAEPWLACTWIWSLAFGVLWSRTARLGWAVLLGAAVAAAGLTKLVGLVLFFLPLECVFWREGALRRRLAYQLCAVWAVALALLAPVVLEAPEHVAYLEESLWAFHPSPDSAPAFLPGLAHIVEWHWAYLTPVGAVVAAWAMAEALRRWDRAALSLVLCWSLWCVACAVVWGRSWQPRDLEPAVALLLAGVACSIAALRARFGFALVAAWALAAVPLDRSIVFEPEAARLPGIERGQYIEGWPSGYGIAELASWLVRSARDAPILVLGHDQSGPMREGLDLRLADASAIDRRRVDLRQQQPFRNYRSLAADKRPVVFVLEQAAIPQLVLSLDGRRALAPELRQLKPGQERQVEAYVVHGELRPPPLAPAAGGPAAARAPGWHGMGILAERERCGWERGVSALRACRRLLDRGVGGQVRAETLYHLGRELLLLGRAADAEHALREADGIVPCDVEQREALAGALEALSRHTEAADALRQVLDVADREVAPALLQRIAWNLALAGRLEEAVALYRRCLALNPAYASARNDLGVCLWLLGREAEAQHALFSGRLTDGEGLRVRYNLAVVEALRGHPDGA
jgi:Flp pilus assembly protein TadD